MLASIVPTAGVPLLHVPPGVASVKVTVEPTHRTEGMIILAGAELTVTIAVT